MKYFVYNETWALAFGRFYQITGLNAYSSLASQWKLLYPWALFIYSQKKKEDDNNIHSWVLFIYSQKKEMMIIFTPCKILTQHLTHG